MTRRISAETFAYRAALIRASLWESEGAQVMRFRRSRALAREKPEPEKRERHRISSERFHQTGGLA